MDNMNNQSSFSDQLQFNQKIDSENLYKLKSQIDNLNENTKQKHSIYFSNRESNIQKSNFNFVVENNKTPDAWKQGSAVPNRFNKLEFNQSPRNLSNQEEQMIKNSDKLFRNGKEQQSTQRKDSKLMPLQFGTPNQNESVSDFYIGQKIVGQQSRSNSPTIKNLSDINNSSQNISQKNQSQNGYQNDKFSDSGLKTLSSIKSVGNLIISNQSQNEINTKLSKKQRNKSTDSVNHNFNKDDLKRQDWHSKKFLDKFEKYYKKQINIDLKKQND